MESIRTMARLVLVVLIVTLSLAACDDTTDEVSIEQHFEQGNQYAQAGELEKAIAEYEAVLEQDADNVSALTNLGVVRYNSGQLDLAISHYEQALEIAPKDADVHSNLAAALVQKNQLDRALEEYSRAVELNPELAEAHFGLGVVYLQLGQSDDAVLAFERFQEFDEGQDPMASDQARQYLQQLRGE